MNVYQRPLFRQMGGPVAPGMAAQEAMMPAAPPAADPMAMAQQAGQQAAQQTQEVGAQYAQQTLQNIDAAQTPEEIINALRGNAVPMEQRYAELAQFVGEADAQRTPESVLALVQPTIMMTEQGAMDSGIGELMQRLTGDIAMETPAGDPTAMGQGLGSLMAAGVPAEAEVGQPPVANFRQGGVVQRFQAGGEASRLQELYSQMLPTYQSIMGDGGEQRRLTQAQILFDIADRAGAFAAGVDPRTGQSVARLSPMAQLGAATSGLGGQIGERLQGIEEQDRALRMAALQAAQGEYSAERADQRAAARAAASAGRDRALGSLYDIYDAEGNVIQQGVPIATQGEYEALMAEIPGGRIAPSRVADAADFDTTTLYGPDGPVTFNTGTAAGRAAAQLALDEGFTTVAPPAPEDLVTYVNPDDPSDRVVARPGSSEALEATGRGLLPVDDASTIAGMRPEPPSGSFINILTADGETVSLREDDPRAEELLAQPGARVVSRTGPMRADPLVDPTIMEAYAAGTLDPAEEARVQAAIAENTRPVFNNDTGRYEQPTITPLVRQAEDARRTSGLSTVITFPDVLPEPTGAAERERVLQEIGGEAFGTAPFFQELANAAFAFVDANAPFPEAQEGVDAVNALNQDALIAFREATGGRTAQEAINQFQLILPTPARIAGSPSAAASEIRQVINLFNAQIDTGQRALRTGVASAAERQRIEQGILSAQGMVRAYQALLDGITRGSGSGSGVDPAQFRR